MSDTQKQVEERNLVLIGAQRAGKTSLMAAWFEFLSQFPTLDMGDVFEEGVDVVARIESIWTQIKEEHIPASPTEQGLVRTNRVEFEYQGRSYAFNFIDLSGETATKAFSGALGDPEVESEVIATCRDADQLYLVISLEDYAEQNRNPRGDLLSFFDKVLKRPDFHTLSKHGLRVYLSHPEKLSDSKREKFVDEIRARFMKARPGLDSDVFSVCSSVVEESKGRVRFSSGEDEHSPDRLFSHTFADLIVVNHPSPTEKLVRKVIKFVKSKTGRWLCGITLIVLICLAVGIPTYLSHQKDIEWAQQVQAYQDLAAKPVTEAVISDRRAEVNRWSNLANKAFPERYKRDEYDLKVRGLLEVFDSVEGKEKQSDDLVAEVSKIVETHKTNYRRLYPAILSVAEKAIANPNRWSEGAKTEWQEIQSFIQALQAGVYLKIATPSFSTNMNDDYILEFQIYETGETVPWGENETSADKIQGLTFPEEDGVKQKKGQYRFAWAKPRTSTVSYRPEADQIVIRFMEQEYWFFESELNMRIPKGGIHGLSYFDEEHKEFSKDGGSWFKFNFKDYSLLDSKKKPLSVPKVLEEVYQ